MTQIEVFNKIHHLIGTPYLASVKAYITELTGYWVFGPGERPLTLDIKPNTLTILSNAEGNILWFSFG